MPEDVEMAVVVADDKVQAMTVAKLDDISSASEQNISDVSRIMTQQSAALAGILIEFRKSEAVKALPNAKDVLQATNAQIDLLRSQSEMFARATKGFVVSNK